MSTIADLEYAYLGSEGATGPTLDDRRAEIYGLDQHAYFAALSGLTPASEFSLADHRLAFYRAVNGTTDGSLADNFYTYLVNGGGGLGWSPADLSNLHVWLDASDDDSFSYSSGDLVSEWRDKGPAGLDFSQATPANQPERSGTINGLPALEFSGDYLTAVGNLGGPQPVTLTAVVRLDNDASARGLIETGSGGTRLVVNSGYTGGAWMVYLGSLAVATDASGTGVQVLFLNLQVAGTYSILNGAQRAFSPGGNAVGGDERTTFLGNEANLAKSFIGAMAEVVVTDGTLSDEDRDALIDYLTEKWVA